MAAAVTWRDDDEWQLVNDDGFVYKSKKRPHLDSSAHFSSTSAPPAPPDLELEHKNRRHRKKTALLMIKKKYEREIFRWDNLSNTLSNMQHKSLILQQQRPQEIHSAAASSDPLSSSAIPIEHSSDSTCRLLIDELLFQVEAQEGIIEDVANLCDIAEAICNEKEEQFKQSIAKLPIWPLSPTELIMLLCDD